MEKGTSRKGAFHQGTESFLNMKTPLKMFVRRDKCRGHEEVLVHIDWENVSEEEIKLMACHYVLNRAAHNLKDFPNKLPDTVEYRAADFVHTEPLVQRDYTVPDSWRNPPHTKAYKKFHELIKDLTPEEIAILLRG